MFIFVADSTVVIFLHVKWVRWHCMNIVNCLSMNILGYIYDVNKVILVTMKSKYKKFLNFISAQNLEFGCTFNAIKKVCRSNNTHIHTTFYIL